MMLGSENHKLLHEIESSYGVKSEWHDHDLEGAVQLVADSSTLCIMVYHLIEKTMVKRLFVLGTQAR